MYSRICYVSLHFWPTVVSRKAESIRNGPVEVFSVRWFAVSVLVVNEVKIREKVAAGRQNVRLRLLR